MKRLVDYLFFAALAIAVACAQTKPEAEPKAKSSKITTVKKTGDYAIYTGGSTLSGSNITSSSTTNWKTFEESTGLLLVSVTSNGYSDTVTLNDYTKNPPVTSEYRSVTEANAAAKKIAEAAAQ